MIENQRRKKECEKNPENERNLTKNAKEMDEK
jgi:hypothetical protein